MALWELDQFQGPQFLGFVRNVPTDPSFRGATWLPNPTVFDLDFEYILGSNSRPVMAHVMGWDSEAPIHGRPGLGRRVQGELPPIKRKARFSEKEIIRFLSPRAGTPDVQTAVNSVYDLTATLLDSVQARVEWLRLKALSEQTVVYNEGGVIFEFDFGLNEEYVISLPDQEDGGGTSVASAVGPAWTDTANSTPLVDEQYVCDKIQDETGFRPATHVMSRKALSLYLSSDSVRAAVRGASAPNTVLTRAELDAIRELYDLPAIETYDVIVRSENADGSYSDERPLAQNRSFMLPPSTATLGDTLWGPTAEARPLIGTNLASQAPGIFATTYGTDEPPEEWVKAVGVAFPSIPGANLLAQYELFAA